MTDQEWLTKVLNDFRKEEIETIKLLSEAKARLIRTEAEIAALKETLIGIRGGIQELTWQSDYLAEKGELP